MRKADLQVGDEVFVCLPYSGGRCWARVDALNAKPSRPGGLDTITVTFLPRQGPSVNRTRNVTPSTVMERRADSAATSRERKR